MSEKKVVETKEYKIELVPTGITGLDRIIGGFIKGRTYLVAGETGTGKTLFALNFIVSGIRRGEAGVYVLIDENVEDLIAGAKHFGWDLDKFIDLNFLSIMTLVPDFSEKFKGKAMEAVARSIVKSIEQEVERINAKRLVIDPVAPLISLEEKDVIKVREYIRYLILELERTVGTTTIITSEIPTGTNLLSRFGVEEFLASGVIVLGLEKTYTGIIRTMFIRKMRWLPVKPSVYRFEIVPKVGIVLREKIS